MQGTEGLYSVGGKAKGLRLKLVREGRGKRGGGGRGGGKSHFFYVRGKLTKDN